MVLPSAELLAMMTFEDVNDLINHVVLPPKLPQRDDSQPGLIGDHLVYLLHRAVEVYISSQPDKQQERWRTVADMVASWGRINSRGDLKEAAIDAGLQNLQADG